MKTTNIQGQLVEVARRFTASPGDVLLIVNGVCLGVNEVATPKSPARRTAPRSEAVVRTVEADVLKAMGVGEHLTTANVAEWLGIPPSDSAGRLILSQLIGAMVKAGHLRKANDSRIGLYVRDAS